LVPRSIAAACRTVRRAEPADAVAGVQPSVVASPASTQEASRLLRAATELDMAVVPRGAGSKLDWGYPPRRCDLVIDMTGMDQVIEHEAGDLVASVQAGITLDRLTQVLSAAGQRLALDPPPVQRPPASGAGHGPTRGTVGGVLAAGVAGPLRLRYGSGRDLLIGITIVRADGTVARSGGKVVKNVAGYDLGKLFAGSRGTLGLITEATFRLHPVPAARAYVVARGAAAASACRLLAAATDSPHAPVAAEIDWPGADSPVSLAIAVEGDADGVAERASLIAGLLAAGATVSEDSPPWWGASTRPDGTVVQVAFWPGDLERTLTAIRQTAREAGLDPALGGSAMAGVLHVSALAEADADAVAAFVTGLRAALGREPTASAGQSGTRAAGPPSRGSAVVLHAPPAVAELVDLFGPVPSLALMRAVKQQFDPGGMMSPGRFAGGI
jgi:glycolate oxidase FAD binding subunit